MSGAPCRSCGAPWQPELAGGCRFCHAHTPPPGAAGLPPGLGLDPEVLAGALFRQAGDAAHPLDPLAATLRRTLGDHVVQAYADQAGNTAWLDLAFNDFAFRFGAQPPTATVRHAVRGIVLKEEQLDFGSGLVDLAVQLAAWAGRDPAAKAGLLSAFS